MAKSLKMVKSLK